MAETEYPAAVPEVGYRYCGGCNPRYDRGDFVKRLAAACPQVSLRYCGPDEAGRARLLICGCPVGCLKPEPEATFFRVTDESDFKAAVEFLRRQAETG